MLKFLYEYQLEWPAWKFGFLKISMLSLGIIIGSMLPEFWSPLHLFLWIIFGVTAAITSVWGFQAMIKSVGKG
ncbi:hypothetical protein N8590_01985 [bacterium]|nr:hypothetical protein [Planctomicrobium sp.]MDA7527723.1 hypothetical protein [bacterium]MDA7527737.1 hypothetical protein [bacterium]